MRILLLNHNFRDVGTYFRAMPIGEHLAGRGHQVTLITVSRQFRLFPRYTMINGVRVIEMPNLHFDKAGEGYGVLDNATRPVIALSNSVDVVHAFDHKPNVSAAALAARWRGATLIADWADWWGGVDGINETLAAKYPLVGRWEAAWEETQKRQADGVVTISSVLYRRAVELGCPPEAVLHMPTGAAIDRIDTLPIDEARRALNVPVDRFIMGFIGVSQTDLEIVMKAMRHTPDAWLMVIGSAKSEVRAMALAHGVADRLWQTGEKGGRDVGMHLACANVMVMPMKDSAANRGRLPNKLLDYLASGRAILANPVGDVKDIVERHACGLLVADDEAFVSGIQTLMANAALRTEMGVRARRAAETEFAWPPLIDKLEAFYHGVRRDQG